MDISLPGWPARGVHWSRQGMPGADGCGETLVLCLDPREQPHGGCSMPNISEWPNDAAVVSLSRVLERGSIPRRYFLTPKACAGILRRAETRGKVLPERLARALQRVVDSGPTSS